LESWKVGKLKNSKFRVKNSKLKSSRLKLFAPPSGAGGLLRFD